MGFFHQTSISNAKSIRPATTFNTVRKSLTAANTEFSHAFTGNIKSFEIKCVDHDAELKISDASGDIAAGSYWTIPKRTSWSPSTPLNVSGLTIYIQSDIITTVEIIEYT